jgi:hypothetical protein
MWIRVIVLASLMTFGGSALAIPPAPPPHTLFPELNGLDIAYVVKKDRMKIQIYVINREKFDVICDAQYINGPDKQDTREIIIPGNGKADKFRFNYGRGGESIHLRLLCVNPLTDTKYQTPEED